MSKKKLSFYGFDAKTGKSIHFTSYKAAADAFGIKSSCSVYRNLQSGVVTYNQILFTEKSAPMKLRRKVYELYWADKVDENIEVWKPYKSVLVSNYGRIKKGDNFVIPREEKNGVIEVYIEGKIHSLARVVAELFIAHRPLKRNEYVYKKGSSTDIRACMLEIDLIEKRWNKTMCRIKSKQVALLDEQNEIVETYLSISEAARANYVNSSVLAKALKKHGRTCGLQFKYLDEDEGDTNVY